MRAVHVTPAVTEEASGPSYSVVRLCEALVDVGEDLTLAALDWAPLPSMPPFMKVFPIGAGPRRLGRSPAMYRWLMRETAEEQVDVLHSHGMWQMSGVYPGWTAKRRGVDLIVSPRGTFSRWAMEHGSRWKSVFWPLIQRRSLAHASCFHATAESEYEDVRRMGFEQPVAVIPNGIDVWDSVEKTPGRYRELLFLGRIHRVKGVEVLLRAWAAVMDQFPDWRLSVVGTDAGYGGTGGHLQEMKDLADALRLRRVEFVGPRYGAAKRAAYQKADLFVLPTHSENFGVAVAEALAAGTPAIVTKGAPWSGLETHEAGWWIEFGVDALVACLRETLAAAPETLSQRGRNGRDWMLREYSWQLVASRMDQTYRWLLSGGETPAWVRQE